jgi:hypothetical protein
MAIVPTITNIDKSECIGNSLVTINGNYTNIQNSLADVDTNIVTINTLLNNLTTIVRSISSTPQQAFAWVNFSGRRETDPDDIPSGRGGTRLENTNRKIFTGYNVASVLRESTGIYRISLINAASPRFCILGTTVPLAPGTAGPDAGIVNIYSGISNDGLNLPPITEDAGSEFRILTRTLQGQNFDPSRICVVVYSA